MCNCNRGGTAPRARSAAAAAVAVRRPTPGAALVRLVYTAPGAIVLRGPVTGRSYHFRQDLTDGISVDARDASALIATRLVVAAR